jgi:hypothetical protein
LRVGFDSDRECVSRFNCMKLVNDDTSEMSFEELLLASAIR